MQRSTPPTIKNNPAKSSREKTDAHMVEKTIYTHLVVINSTLDDNEEDMNGH